MGHSVDIMACYAKSMMKMLFNGVYFVANCITDIIQDVHVHVIQQEPTWQAQKSTQVIAMSAICVMFQISRLNSRLTLLINALRESGRWYYWIVEKV